MNLEKSVLKKVGITAAIVTAGLFAVSPLAFADGGHHSDRGDHGKVIVTDNDFSNDRSDNLSNRCEFGQASVGGPLIAAPLPAVSQEQSSNCVNVNDTSLPALPLPLPLPVG